MKYVKLVLVALLIVVVYCSAPEVSLVSADDNFGDNQRYSENDHDKERPYEDIAGLIGWGTVILLGAAGAIYPIRRLTKIVIMHFPEFKKTYLFIVKKIGKYHLIIGLLTLLLGAAHGILMYVSEWKLESDGLIGLIGLVFMFVATIVGIVLNKYRKMKSLRTIHLILVVVAVLISIVHIVFS